MNWERLRQKALEKFYPEEEELRDLEEVYEEISAFIESEYGFKTFFAGSAGRGTCVKRDRDIDVFILFPGSTERQNLEDIGLKIGEEVFKHFEGDFRVEYAEHPYTKGEIQGYEVEIVPCIDTSPENIQSAVDRSPHHAKWVRESLSQEQKEDVVLLKAFLKAQDLYGSSLKNRGFSGYLCEILVAEYGSFREVVEEAAEWREETVIDVENHHGELPQDLEEKFSSSSLKVIDPVDPERNVASVLTSENYAEFIHSCWRFSREPGMKFFEKSEVDVEKFELEQEVQKRADFLVLEFEAIDEPEDIVYPQMRKTLRRLEKKLEGHDFRLYESGFHVGGKIRVFFELESSLPGVEYMQGPKVYHGTQHLDEFTSKYANTFVRGERVCAKVEREYTEAKRLLKDFVDCSSARLEEKGVPGNVAEKMVEMRMTDPIQDDEEWLKFLAEKLKVGQ
ncbi:MAG: CCA tRNA nucleotidyltransferase [Candidatus Nanosalina sp.]